MLKISSQRLLINLTSSYISKQDFLYPYKLAENSWLLILYRNFKTYNYVKVQIIFKRRFFFTSLMFLTNEFFFYKSSLLHLQLTFLIRYFYTFCSFAHQVLKEIHLILFLDTLRQKWWFHSFVNHIFLSCKFPLNSVFKLSWKFVALHFHRWHSTELIMFGKFLKCNRKTFW